MYAHSKKNPTIFAFYKQLWITWNFKISQMNVCIKLSKYFFESFLAHLRRKLKWAFLITMCSLSVVVVVVVVNFSYFHLLQKHRANFNQTWHKASLGKGDSSLLTFFLLIIALCKCVHWLELFLRWALWPMGLLLLDYSNFTVDSKFCCSRCDMIGTYSCL